MRLGPVLHGSRLDDAGRLEDPEVELLEQRELRRERAQQEHDREQRNQDEQRPEDEAAQKRDQHGRHDAGLVDLQRGVIYDLGAGAHFSMGTRIELPHSVHEPS